MAKLTRFQEKKLKAANDTLKGKVRLIPGKNATMSIDEALKIKERYKRVMAAK